MSAHDHGLVPGGPPHPAVAALLARGEPAPAAVGAFLAAHEFPLAEPGRVTFAWFGEADRVELLSWVHAGVDRTAFERVPGTRLWLATAAAEDGGRFEYKLAVHRDGQEEWTVDPLNPATAQDPFGHNSEARTHGYERPAWTEPQGAPGGRVAALKVHSACFGQTRAERVYLPPRLVPGSRPRLPLPLLIVHDGQDFAEYADLVTCLDNLIDAGDIPPLVAALIQSGDRMEEYPRARLHARYVVRELLPALEARFDLAPEPSRRVLLGASLGAVASLSTLFRYPGTFGGAVLNSGTFIVDEAALETRPNPVFHRAARLVAAVGRARPLPPTRAYVSTGELEGLAGENRALASLLEGLGVEVRFDSAWDGHHWHNWRDRLRDALMWVMRTGDGPEDGPGGEAGGRDRG